MASVKLKSALSISLGGGDSVTQDNSPLQQFSTGENKIRRIDIMDTNEATSPDNLCGSYGFSQRDGYKSPTEDRIVVLNIDSETTLFGVFDGHGGTYAVDYISSMLPDRIKQRILDMKEGANISAMTEKVYSEKLASILEEAFVAVDDDLVHVHSFFSGGSTGTVAITTATSVIVANIGDSPCIMFSKIAGDRIIHETTDHTPKNEDELRRIKSNGGTVSSSFDGSDRVDGNLSVTRAFGHRRYKLDIPDSLRVITSRPQTYIWEKLPYAMLVVCSDSFTEEISLFPKPMIRNSLSNADILSQVYSSLTEHGFDLAAAAEALCEDQVNKFYFPAQGYAGDNTSILLIDLSAQSTPFPIVAFCPKESPRVAAVNVDVLRFLQSSGLVGSCVAPSVFENLAMNVDEQVVLDEGVGSVSGDGISIIGRKRSSMCLVSQLVGTEDAPEESA